MKRLLLPLLAALALPTAVNANLFSNDLTIKTDLGEKFIIKESALELEIFDGSDLKKILNKSQIKKLNESIEKAQTLVDILKDEPANEVLKERQNNKKVFEKSLNKIDMEKVHLNFINYRMIFVDLNNKKTASGVNNLSCFNPKLNQNSLSMWREYAPSFVYEPKNNLEERICKKYAKF